MTAQAGWFLRTGRYLSLIAVAICLTGCAGFRSGAVDQLATIEFDKVGTLHQLLASKKDVLAQDIKDLKDAHLQQINALREWERQVTDARTITAVPGDIDDPVVRRALYYELADLRLTGANAFDGRIANFNARADAIVTAFNALVDAVHKSQKSFKPVLDYAKSSSASYAIQSVDADTVGAAIAEFQGAQDLLAQVVEADKKVDPLLTAATKANADPEIADFLNLMNILSAKLKAIPK
jgi:hypothetical protein